MDFLRVLLVLYFFNYINCLSLHRYGIHPRLDEDNLNGHLTWYTIGTPSDFSSIKQKKITIRDNNYIIWRDNEKYYGIRDACSHQGSSFEKGCIYKDTISCPYHGYTFNSNGELKDIPKYDINCLTNTKIDSFKVIEKGGFVYLNTIPNEDTIDDICIWTEPEYSDKNQNYVILKKDFEHNAKFVSINSLDICHIGFVHTFGNKKSPNPVLDSVIQKIDDHPEHYKITYEYLAGEKSLVKKIYNFDKIIVENEYVLPHTTVARVKFGEYSSTIITQALPVSKFKTKLFVKAYRNYFYKNSENEFLMKPLYELINYFGDKITQSTMETTLNQDKAIIDNIDKTNYKLMHGKFSIKYDKLSNHYKNKYKSFYESDINDF
jgi:phenylpropionate dioxygenase-like ring-hydroxylating dioxygenase large terminal subunit